MKELLEILNKDRVGNINLINFIAQNGIVNYERAGDSVLVRGQSDRRWIFVSSSSEAELRTLLSKRARDDVYFAAIDDWMFAVITEGRQVVWDLPMLQFILTEDRELPRPKHKTESISVTDAKTVYQHSEYRDLISVEYVKDRILRGVTAGIYEKNRLVAWAMTQDDGGMGFLHVLKNYRKRGYGLDVTISLIEKLRQRSNTPFAYIEKDNHKALNLISKLGFEQDKSVHWFQIRD